MYVDDLISAGYKKEELIEVNGMATEIFQERGFTLHKWHTNCSIESHENHYEHQFTNQITTKSQESQAQASHNVLATLGNIISNINREILCPGYTAFVKQQLGTKSVDTKMLGIHWNESEDTLSIEILQSKEEYTKCNIRSHLASIYDPLGFISPVYLLGKIVYQESCELKLPCDEKIPTLLVKKWNKWLTSSPYKITIPRSITLPDANINHADIHVFGDSSIVGTCAYALVFDPNRTQQNIIASKSRLAKQKLSIPRLELVAAHMTANLADNIKTALTNLNFRNVFGWTDSTVVLHWLEKNGNYNQFVNNRADKIKGKDYITWRHVPTNKNPADIGSRVFMEIKSPAYGGTDQLGFSGPYS